MKVGAVRGLRGSGRARAAAAPWRVGTRRRSPHRHGRGVPGERLPSPACVSVPHSRRPPKPLASTPPTHSRGCLPAHARAGRRRGGVAGANAPPVSGGGQQQDGPHRRRAGGGRGAARGGSLRADRGAWVAPGCRAVERRCRCSGPGWPGPPSQQLCRSTSPTLPRSPLPPAGPQLHCWLLGRSVPAADSPDFAASIEESYDGLAGMETAAVRWTQPRATFVDVQEASS